MSPHPQVDTAAQRPATGLDVGARHLMMKVAEDVIAERRGRVPAPELMVGCLFKDRYGGMHDYMNAVQSVWGGPAQFLLARAVDEARAEADFGVNSLVTLNTGALANRAGAATLLAQMPEPDPAGRDGRARDRGLTATRLALIPVPIFPKPLVGADSGAGVRRYARHCGE